MNGVFPTFGKANIYDANKLLVCEFYKLAGYMHLSIYLSLNKDGHYNGLGAKGAVNSYSVHGSSVSVFSYSIAKDEDGNGGTVMGHSDIDSNNSLTLL